MAPSRAAVRRSSGPVVAGVLLLIAGILSAAFTVIPAAAFGVYRFNLADVGTICAFIGGGLAVIRVNRIVVQVFASIAGVLLGIRAALLAGGYALYGLPLTAVVLAVVAILLIERSRW